MRRLALALSALLTASLVPLATAAAADTTVVVPWNEFPDDYADLSWVGCDDLFTRGVQLPLSYVGNEPEPAPLGDVAWAMLPQAANEAVGGYVVVDHLATTTTAGMTFDSVGPATGAAYVVYTPTGTTDQTYWVGRAALAAADTGWQSVDVIGLTYAWQKRDPNANGGGGGYIADGGSATIAGFLPTHGLDGEAGFTIGYGCNGNKVWFDAFKVGSPGSVLTYDLEEERSKTTISSSASTITAGGAVTLTGTAMPVTGSTGYGSATLHLEARKAGEVDFVEVGEAYVPEGGDHVTLAVKPTVTTEYRWRFDGGNAILGSVSPAKKIQVRTAVTAVVADRTLMPGQALVVTGKTTPKKPGFAATLWRKTATGRTKLTTATIKADGTFRLSKRVRTKGVWKVFVTVPASSDNLAGTSLIRKATVR